jgi:hypothetical protein
VVWSTRQKKNQCWKKISGDPKIESDPKRCLKPHILQFSHFFPQQFLLANTEQRGVEYKAEKKSVLKKNLKGGSPEIRPRKVPKTPYFTLLTFSSPQLGLGTPPACDII